MITVQDVLCIGIIGKPEDLHEQWNKEEGSVEECLPHEEAPCDFELAIYGKLDGEEVFDDIVVLVYNLIKEYG